jgi:hypothetical protein
MAMAFLDFLDLLLARDHHSTQQGLRYFWVVLDVQRRGLPG